MRNNLLAFLCLAAVFIPQVTLAATVLIGDKITIEAEEVVEGDYYVSVGSLGTTVMSGTIEGDMYSLAGNVTTNGEIHGDFGSVGGLAFVHASVTDDVRIVAGEAIIDDYVGGDVLVIGGVLKILSTANIAGDVIFYGFDAEINGPVGGSVYGSAQTLRIDAPVGGVVDVSVLQNLTLGSSAEIAGDVRYEAPGDLVRAQEAIVEGEVQRKPSATISPADAWRSLLIPLFVALFATLTLYLLFKKELLVIVMAMLQSPLPAGLLGLLTLVVGPFVSILLISTVLGLLLGVFGVGLMLLLVSLSFAVSIVYTGALIAKAVVGRPVISLPWILLGAVVFHGLLFIPYLGPTLVLITIALSIGGMVITLYRRLV